MPRAERGAGVRSRGHTTDFLAQPPAQVVLRPPVIGVAARSGAAVSLRDLSALCKPRIVVLICLTALAGAFAGAGSVPSAPVVAALMIAVSLSAAGASALNHYFERDLDSRMQRTGGRPLPSGRIADPRVALVFGCVLLASSLPAMAALGAWVTLFGLLGAATYAGLYTLVLKPRTSWNIVVGGLAGSFAAMGGWSATASPLEPAALLLGLVLFLWTPPHFWSLAIALEPDYRRAGLPMLPPVVGTRGAAVLVAIHVMLLLSASVAFALVGGLGPLTLAAVALGGTPLLATSVLLVRNPTEAHARTTFKLSGLYLLMILVAVVVDAGL